MREKMEVLQIVLLSFVIYALVILLGGCGTDESNDSNVDSSITENYAGEIDPLLGSWFIEDGYYCGLGFEIKDESYALIYLCMVSDNVAEMSYKIIDRSENLSGTVIESTCDDVGASINYNGSVTNGKMNVNTGTALITGLRPNNESSDVEMTYIYGCYGSDGIFEQTQIFK